MNIFFHGKMFICDFRIDSAPMCYVCVTYAQKRHGVDKTGPKLQRILNNSQLYSIWCTCKVRVPCHIRSHMLLLYQDNNHTWGIKIVPILRAWWARHSVSTFDFFTLYFLIPRNNWRYLRSQAAQTCNKLIWSVAGLGGRTRRRMITRIMDFQLRVFRYNL